ATRRGGRSAARPPRARHPAGCGTRWRTAGRSPGAPGARRHPYHRVVLAPRGLVPPGPHIAPRLHTARIEHYECRWPRHVHPLRQATRRPASEPPPPSPAPYTDVVPRSLRNQPPMSPPYDRPSDPAKRHSAALTDGPDRAGARAMLKAVGFTDEDLAKPLIG